MQAMFPRIPGASEARANQEERKRAWEDDNVDDIPTTELDNITLSTTPNSRATKRRNVKRRNAKASAREEAKQRAMPEWRHMRVYDAGFFQRHCNSEWKFADPDPLVLSYLQRHPIPGLAGVEKENCFMLPCSAAQMAHLRYFDRPPRPRPTTTPRALTRAIDLVGRMLTVDIKLPFPHAEDLRNVPFKPRKYPGIEYRQRGMKTRGDAHEAAIVDAEEAWVHLMDDEYVEPHTVRLGGRGKLAADTREALEEKGIPKGRLILMLSQRDLLLLGVTEKLLTEEYKKGCYPVSVGMGWYKGHSEAFYRRMAPCTKFFCMDAEKFDSAIDPWMIDAAITIVRRQFERGTAPVYDRYWDFVRETLLSAPIARDDGWCTMKEVGTTSGHSHNTLLQSIITLIVGYAGLFALCPEERWEDLERDVEMDALGDDNSTGVPEWLEHITAQALGDEVFESSGINWRGKKSFATYTLEDEHMPMDTQTEEGRFGGVQYLGKFLRRQDMAEVGGEGDRIIPYRPCKESVLRLLFPERYDPAKEHTYLRAIGNLLDNYGNPIFARWCNGFLDELGEQIEFLPSSWPTDSVQDSARDYTSEVVMVPKPRRWSFEEWLSLTLSIDDDDIDDLFDVTMT